MSDPIFVDSMNCDEVKLVADLAKKGKIEDFMLEPKLDGFRLIAEILDDSRVVIYTRTHKENQAKLPHIVKELLETFPAGTIVDGEVCYFPDGYPGKNDFEWVQSVMLSLPARAVEIQEETGKLLSYWVFDMIASPKNGIAFSKDHPLWDRKQRVSNAIVAASDDAEHLFAVPWLDATQEHHDYLVSSGLEGTVAKDQNSRYVIGGTGKGWYKLKHHADADFVILGFTEGEGKYKGQIGAVIFGQPPFEMTYDEAKALMKKGHVFIDVDDVKYLVRGQCSGMTDDLRKFFSDNRKTLPGQVMTMKHNGVMAGGVKFRHPQFIRMRPDKPAAQVVWHDG